jgi:hypothetical protein
LTNIYKITNSKTGKLYIGATSKTLTERWNSHLRDARKDRCKNRPLYFAMNEYGIEYFSVDLIEQVASDISDIREQYWIKFFDTSKIGYNYALGGKGRPEYDHEIILDLYNQGMSNVAISKQLNCCIETVRDTLMKYNIRSKNFNYTETYGIPISQYAKDGTFIRNFKSSGEASTHLSNNNGMDTSTMRSHIREVVNGKRHTAYGYIWKNYSQ